MQSQSNTLTLASTKVLGKRKSSNKDYHRFGILHSSPDPTSSEYSELEDGLSSPKPQGSAMALILLNGTLVPQTDRRYHCTFQGCSKGYTKMSRLAEHERTHTGERPFSCETCHKRYFRETHLHAHARTHLPEASKPLACDFKNCSKRFWTPQHLRIHRDWHNGVKPFLCREEGCSEAFSKHHQLRAHICESHAPPGTKPYRCQHDSCTKSFSTNQHLRTHQKTHDAHRYTCVHLTCLARSDETPTFFPTWSALQHHIRTMHPPVCTYPTCNGRTFASQKGFRAHEKLHEQREAEAEFNDVHGSENDESEPVKKKRRGGELGRDWKCGVDKCGKDFKSKKALVTHTNITHLGKRDFVCLACRQTYGYKHLLQRHMSKAHISPTGPTASDEDDEEHLQSESFDNSSHIDTITGKAYASLAEARIAQARALYCPFPDLEDMQHSTPSEIADRIENSSLSTCKYVFTRAYDLRRHLRASHGILTEKEEVDRWVTVKRR